jgi:site-specific DNA recombinase
MSYNDNIKNLKPDEIIIYLRKSRADNPAESVEEVLEKHETILQDFARQTWTYQIPESNIYREVVSGETIEARPMMQAIISLIELPQYKAILAVEPQRLTRGDLVDCGTIINSLRYTNTLMITPAFSYDLNNKQDRKFFESELMRGNDYLEYTKEIMSRGRIAAARRGCFIGNVAPYGYQKHVIGKDHTLAPDPDEAPVLKQIYEWYVYDDVGADTIAKRLDKLNISPRNGGRNWNSAAIKDMLHNPVYNGKIRWGYRATKKIMVDGQLISTRPQASDDDYIIVDGLHDAIVPHDLWLAAQEKKGRTTRKKASTKVRNPLAGLVVCPCGRMMSLRTYRKNGIERSAPRLLCDNQSNCHTRSVLYQDMISAIIDILTKYVNDFQVKLDSSSAASHDFYEKRIESMQSEINKLEEKSERQKDLLEDGIYTKTEYVKRNSEVRKRIQALLLSIEKLQKETPPNIDYQQKIHALSKAISMLKKDNSNPEELNKLLKSIIEKIEYRSEVDTIRFSGEKLKGGWKPQKFNIDVYLKF